MAQPPLKFVFYIAAPIEQVWEGFVSKEANRTIFMGAELEVELRAGGPMNWVGKDKEGKSVTFVHGEVLQAEAPKLLQYTFAIGPSTTFSRVTIQLVAESEAVQVIVTHDEWSDGDGAYHYSADGWPRILSRLKTLLETGRTFKPH